MNNQNDTQVITGNVRLFYVNVWEPASFDYSSSKYSCAIVIPKSDVDTICAINKAIDCAIDEEIDKSVAKISKDDMLKSPLHDGDIQHYNKASYRGCYFVNATSKDAPRIVDKYGRAILDHSEIYDGVYARVSLSFCVYNNGDTKGVACHLGNIQKTYDCDALSNLPVELPVAGERTGSEQNNAGHDAKMRCQEASLSQKWTDRKDFLSNYLQIPRTIIEAKSLGKMRATVFAVLHNCKGLDGRVILDALGIVKYTKVKEDAYDIGAKFETVQTLLDTFESEGYIKSDVYGVNESCVSYLFNSEKVREEEYEYGCGYISPDELKKILKYKNEDENKCYDPDNTLLLLAYLKMNIGPQIDETKEYAAHYGDIADVLGLSVSTVSDAADALREMGLINFTRVKSFTKKGFYFTRELLLKEDWATTEE